MAGAFSGNCVKRPRLACICAVDGDERVKRSVLDGQLAARRKDPTKTAGAGPRYGLEKTAAAVHWRRWLAYDKKPKIEDN